MLPVGSVEKSQYLGKMLCFEGLLFPCVCFNPQRNINYTGEICKNLGRGVQGNE